MNTMMYQFSLYGFLKNLKFFDPFLILFFREAGLSFLHIGILIAVRDISTTMLELPTGIYADAFGRRKSMIMSFVSYIFSFIIFFTFLNYYAFLGAMILFGLGEAFRSGTHKAMILEYLRIHEKESQKVEYYGSTRAASELGSAVSSLIAAGLVFYSGGYRYIFAAAVIPYMVNVINLAAYPHELDGQIVIDRRPVKEQIETTLKDFFKIFKNFVAMKAIINSSVFKAYFKVTKDYLQPVLKAYALSLPVLIGLEETSRISLVVGAVYFGVYLCTSYSSKSSARITNAFTDLTTAVNVTYITGGILLVLAGLSTAYRIELLAIAAFVLFYMLYNVRRPMTVSYVTDQISHRVMASGLSVESQTTTLVQAGIAVAIGAFADAYGVGIALVLMGVFMVAGHPLIRVKYYNPKE